jgi:HD-GYP domain-containing protein (c-di-GMP phosphodiesterase class II)
LSLPPFREVTDSDEKRKEIVWIALSFIVILGSWLAVVLFYGYRPLALGMSYDEIVLGVGGGLLLACSVAYLGVREREHRLMNRALVSRLGDAVTELDARVRHLKGLCEISGRLIGSVSIDRTARLIVDSLTQNMEVESACLVLVDEHTGLPVYLVRSSDGAPAQEANCPPGETAWPAPVANREGRLTDPEAQIRAWNELGRALCAPICARGALVGLLSVQRKPEAAAFASDDLDTLTTFANMAAKAFESAHLHAELRENYLATVRSLIYSLDARDNYAAAHGHRVAELAIRIAEQMGLSEGLMRDLEVFAPLHDVGKVGIPDAILLKPGPLDLEEREICRSHPVIGERIVRPLKPSRDAISLVRNHHESWDGRGYPDGLQGEEIPLLARILQVADCYDALITERPYRPVVTEEEVLSHFQVNAGIQYDPAVVAALRAVIQGERAEAPAEAGPTSREARTRAEVAS